MKENINNNFEGKGKSSVNWTAIKIVSVICVILIIFGCMAFPKKSEVKLQAIKNQKEYEEIYLNYSSTKSEILTTVEELFAMVAKIVCSTPFNFDISYYYEDLSANAGISESVGSWTDSKLTNATSSDREYSTTNIQVEDVDEADIIKTDGKYIYSISEKQVILTDARDEKNAEIVSRITNNRGDYPVDLMVYGDKLVVVYDSSNTTFSTNFSIYDTSDKENPTSVKEVRLTSEYSTMRLIDNRLYCLLKKSRRSDVTKYAEDFEEKTLPFSNMYYFNDSKSYTSTQIVFVDLDNPQKDIELNTYLIDLDDVYVSENNLYVVNEKYTYNRYKKPSFWRVFGIGGMYSLIVDELNYSNSSSSYETEIYKFNLKENGTLEFVEDNKIEGRIINQYSLDEYDDNLRVASYESSIGSKITVFDQNMNKIGETEDVAKGENMYSSRFMGDRAYFVTYRNTDPLYSIDLSDPTNPKVLGELKIPGYSTYLHPYDETHLIGFGIDSKEITNRTSTGNVITTNTGTLALKIALFDVSDIKNPQEISHITIGDSRTKSAILDNPKALLFSKEKNILAIPVNNYVQELKSNYTTTTVNSALASQYKNLGANYTRESEGYFVYKFDENLDIQEVGKVTHEISDDDQDNSYSYIYYTRLLRGLYIGDNLYTVSEDEIKVSSLEDLSLIQSIKIIEDKNNKEN